MRQSSLTQHDFTVISNTQVAEGVWRMVFASEVVRSIEPGQFMNFEVPGDGSHILRIPLSFSLADAAHGRVVIYYAVVGEGTGRLARMRPQEASTLLGPCGNGWRLPADTSKRALLVAGGIGLPPVVAVADLLAAAGVGFDVAIGLRTKDALAPTLLQELELFQDKDTQVRMATDDGSLGLHGFATQAAEQLLSERDYGSIYTCGPQVMMAGVAKLASERGIACQVSMERMMGCGFGACACCNVALAAGGYALCCQDGPVFDAQEVAW